VAPHHLSVDYSYDCLPLVHTPHDVHTLLPSLLLSLLLYVSLLFGLASTLLAPLVSLLLAEKAKQKKKTEHEKQKTKTKSGHGRGEDGGGEGGGAGGETVGAGRGAEGLGGMALGWGLLLAPMLPASNVFFPVGTLVAERLLYLPSGLELLVYAALKVLVYEAFVSLWGLWCMSASSTCYSRRLQVLSY
jgi:hypothetical protein